MTHTLVKLYAHIVFSTKKRQPYFRPEHEDPVQKYIAGICKNLECSPIRIGGHRDHVHILCALNKNISLVELVEEVKIESSRWLKNNFDSMKTFSWQQGYACFSVGEESLPIVSHYIENQKQHHAGTTFEDELRKLLIENDIEFDEHVVWK